MERFKLFYAFTGGAAVSAVCGVILENSLYDKKQQKESDVKDGLAGAVGDTPLIKLKSLSEATGRNILVKAEYLNAGGSVKDRPAVRMLQEAVKAGHLKPGGTVVEATGGNTGVSLAFAAKAMGFKAVFTMPSLVSEEKKSLMKYAGAEVIVRPILPFSDPGHYFHVAETIAKERPGAFMTNQFDNVANFLSHYEGTGPEILLQSGGNVHGFVCAAGTGGTIGGISAFLKEKLPWVKTALVDCTGSSLYSQVAFGKLESIGPSTFVEGIGNGRITDNFAKAKIDMAFQCTDREAIEMAYYLLRNEGLYVGPSSALNVVGAVKLARKLPAGKTVVTILCDGADRYQSKMMNEDWLKKNNLTPKETGTTVDFVL